MTNSMVQLSNQIVLLEKHIVTLESNTIQLSNYIGNSISHTQYINGLDSAITVTTIAIGILTLAATTMVFLFVHKFFDSYNQRKRLEKDIEAKVTNRVINKFDELKDELSFDIKRLTNFMLDTLVEFKKTQNEDEIDENKIESIKQEKEGNNGKEKK